MNINNCFELIEYDDIKDIKKLYKNHLIDNNLPIDNDNSNVQKKVIMKKNQIQNYLLVRKKK